MEVLDAAVQWISPSRPIGRLALPVDRGPPRPFEFETFQTFFEGSFHILRQLKSLISPRFGNLIFLTLGRSAGFKTG